MNARRVLRNAWRIATRSHAGYRSAACPLCHSAQREQRGYDASGARCSSEWHVVEASS